MLLGTPYKLRAPVEGTMCIIVSSGDALSLYGVHESIVLDLTHHLLPVCLPAVVMLQDCVLHGCAQLVRSAQEHGGDRWRLHRT
jgi:hypothetical protein